MKCLILTSRGSWFNSYTALLKGRLAKDFPEIKVTISHQPTNNQSFNFCLILSYEKLLPESFLKNKSVIEYIDPNESKPPSLLGKLTIFCDLN